MSYIFSFVGSELICDYDSIGLHESTDLARSVEDTNHPPYESDEADRSDTDSEEGVRCKWKHHTKFVYDAAKERREEWIREGKHTMAVH